MKTTIKILTLSALLFVGVSIAPVKASAQDFPVSYQVFYDELSPYGTWVNTPEFGYAWVPNVAPGFTPYATGGYWLLTEEGWLWYSTYYWGWATFHYGRWYSDALYGPMWVPGEDWSPGWVIWKSSPGYFGWAAMAPGIGYNTAYSDNYNVPVNQWTFVEGRLLGSTDIAQNYVNTSKNAGILDKSSTIDNTRVILARNVFYCAGPRQDAVEKLTGNKITPSLMRYNETPGKTLNNNRLQIYSPEVDKLNSSGSKPVPSRSTTLKEMKTPGQPAGSRSKLRITEAAQGK